MNGTKTIIALSAALGAIFGGLVVADWTAPPERPGIRLFCGDRDLMNSRRFREAVARVAHITKTHWTNNIAQQENIIFRRSKPVIDGAVTNEMELDCLMELAGFEEKYVYSTGYSYSRLRGRVKVQLFFDRSENISLKSALYNVPVPF